MIWILQGSSKSGGESQSTDSSKTENQLEPESPINTIKASSSNHQPFDRHQQQQQLLEMASDASRTQNQPPHAKPHQEKVLKNYSFMLKFSPVFSLFKFSFLLYPNSQLRSLEKKLVSFCFGYYYCFDPYSLSSTLFPSVSYLLIHKLGTDPNSPQKIKGCRVFLIPERFSDKMSDIKIEREKELAVHIGK